MARFIRLWLSVCAGFLLVTRLESASNVHHQFIFQVREEKVLLTLLGFDYGSDQTVHDKIIPRLTEKLTATHEVRHIESHKAGESEEIITSEDVIFLDGSRNINCSHNRTIFGILTFQKETALNLNNLCVELRRITMMPEL
jgi:hypothetical protein